MGSFMGLTREETGALAVYVHGSESYWFVPTLWGDQLLQKKAGGMDCPAIDAWLAEKLHMEPLAASVARERFLSEIQPTLPTAGIRDRDPRELRPLAELWIHLTNNCNLACQHCLFSCQPDTQALELSAEQILRAAEEAYALGCRLILLTGGEPLMHPEWPMLCERLLAFPEMRVAVLSNGLLLPRHLETLRKLDLTRLHFQISLDGSEERHDELRGQGTHAQTLAAILQAKSVGISCSAVMAVNPTNVCDLSAFVDLLAASGISEAHWMWHFERGQGAGLGSAATHTWIPQIMAAWRRAKQQGVQIDNFEALRAQVFAPLGARFDVSNAGWESLALGPDGFFYPTPAMVNLTAMRCGRLAEGMEAVWRSHPRLVEIRQFQRAWPLPAVEDPWRWLIGWGDLDHMLEPSSDPHAVAWGPDPYLPLYRAMALGLLEEAANSSGSPDQGLGLRLRMGDILTDCPSAEQTNFTHSNCLLAFGAGDHRSLIKNFYAARAVTPDAGILNPVHYAQSEIDFIPEEGRVRMYGCGSPVSDAELAPGEVVVDLGSGTGVEVFMAAKKVGPSGRAIGIDMTTEMLSLARGMQPKVAARLGYANTEFKQGYLEQLPLPDACADVIISNCVINLSQNKRKVFKEITRVLKPGGRLVVADVVTESEPEFAIRADQRLQGECLGGAYVQEYLFAVLAESGLVQAEGIKRFPYRRAGDHPFYSLTYRAWRPLGASPEPGLYMGPYAAVVNDAGEIFMRGRAAGLRQAYPTAAGFWLLDPKTGAVRNQKKQNSCCGLDPAPAALKEQAACCASDPTAGEQAPTGHASGCLICGAKLQYTAEAHVTTCSICGRESASQACCAANHYVCDACHAAGPLSRLHAWVMQTKSSDLAELFSSAVETLALPMHGPEYHALVAAVILAAARHAGREITSAQMLGAIQRASAWPGGGCGSSGICGAAAGAGTAAGVLLASHPLRGSQRQALLGLTAAITRRLSAFPATRCCQRDARLALATVSALSSEIFDLSLGFTYSACRVYEQNQECARALCPFFPQALRSACRAPEEQEPSVLVG
jgi:MoaA/NifB/PqqE/SkfB family radical SAM enzyme/SAM-dependent methyltransferase